MLIGSPETGRDGEDDVHEGDRSRMHLKGRGSTACWARDVSHMSSKRWVGGNMAPNALHN